MRRLALVVLLPCLLAGCPVASGSLEISAAQLDGEVAASIVRVDIFVFSGTLPDAQALICEPFTTGEILPHDEDLDLSYEASLWIDPDTGLPMGAEPTAIGRLHERVLFYVLAYDAACRVVARTCLPVILLAGRERHLVLELDQVDPPESVCEEGLACLGGVCGPCTEADQCDDLDPCTIDACSAGVCIATEGLPDSDRDGFGDPDCGGDDCDDGDGAVHPGAPRRCGRGVDHDCDDVVDDSQGCDPCPAPTAMRLLSTIDAPAASLYALGPDPEGPGEVELFVGTRNGSVDVYTVDRDGSTVLQASTEVAGVTSLAPQVIGEHTLVADDGSAGLSLYLTEDLRGGSATALARVGEDLGTVKSFVSGTRFAYFGVSAGEGSLAEVAVSQLPALSEPSRASSSGGWGQTEAIARDGAWLFGVSGTVVSWAMLDDDGSVDDTGRIDLTGPLGPAAAGFGTGVALLDEWVILAQGDAGLLLIPRDHITTPDDCCEDHALELPEGCVGPECQAVRDVALAGPGRVVALSVGDHGGHRAYATLVDVSDPTAPRELHAIPLSDPDVVSEGIVINGSLAFAAASESAGSGVVDVLELLCE